MSWAVRITLNAVELAQTIQNWNAHCTQIIAYEHPSPPAARTHCHLLLINCRVTPQRLKQLSGRDERGNHFWNFKRIQTPVRGDPLTWADTDKYITYMTKGRYDPQYVGTQHYYEWNMLEERKLQWVEPPIIQRKLTTLERYNEFKKHIREMPLEHRADRDLIRVHARAILWAHHKMINQQYRNDMANFVDSYCFEFRLH